MTSVTRFQRLERVFSGGRSPLLNRIAQLSVLYEDLRLELSALTGKSKDLRRLGILGKEYRVMYFLRRSIATVFEFAGALNEAVRTAEYKKAELVLDQALREQITKSTKQLNQSSGLLKGLRNDVGGHFLIQAASHATSNVPSEWTSKLEIVFDRSMRAEPKYHYAKQIVAGAIVKSLSNDRPVEEEYKQAIRTIRDCYSSAAEAMHALVLAFLWERFG